MADPLPATPATSNPNPPAPAPSDFLAALQRLTRSGFRSSEFWLVLCAIALLVFGAVEDKLPPALSEILAAGLVVAYKYTRAQVKGANGDQIVSLAVALGDGAAAKASVGRSDLAAAVTAALEEPPRGPNSFLEPHPLGAAEKAEKNARIREEVSVELAGVARSVSPSIALALLLFSGCTTVYERGPRNAPAYKLLSIGSNVKALHLVSAGGTHLDIGEVDNAVIHKTLGSAIGNGAVGVGTGIAGSGIPALLK